MARDSIPSLSDIEIMRQTGRSHGQALGALQSEVAALRETVAGQSVTITTLTESIREEVIPVIRSFPSMISESRKDHEAGCPWFVAKEEKARKDITERFMISRPPKRRESAPPTKSKMNNKLKQAIIGLIIAATTFLTTYLSSSCNSTEHKETDAAIIADHNPDSPGPVRKGQ